MSNQQFLFWWRWLIVVTIGVILFSLSFVFIPEVVRDIFNNIFYTNEEIEVMFTEETYKFIDFVYGVLGAVMIGWMTAFLFVLFGAFRRGEPLAWQIITLSMLIWYIIDSLMSVATGFVANAVLNTVFLILFAIPLAATYRYFHGSSSVSG